MSFSTLKLPSKDSAVARALRVLVYTILPAFLMIAADPTVMHNIQNYAPWLLPIFVSGPPIASLIYNILRTDVANYR